MAHLIDKDALVTEIERFIERAKAERVLHPKTVLAVKDYFLIEDYNKLLSFINTLEVKDPYEQCVQYDSIEAGIQVHAEIYSFNIESKLFNQLTKEQQALWRKEIEQACISGGEAGVELARDQRYKENLEVKDVNLEREIDGELKTRWMGEYLNTEKFYESAKHFFELGLKAQKGE